MFKFKKFTGKEALEFAKGQATLHARSGPFTSELLRAPGKFGLGQVPARLVPDAKATSICGYCSTGCQLDIHLRDGQAINLTPATKYPVNLGMACPKGWEALTVLDATDRATKPILDGKEIDWKTAADAFCDRFQKIQKRSGPEAVAFLSTGQITVEDFFLLGSFAKFGMGMKHGDGNTRQCMATAATAYKQSFGFDAPPYTYRDFEESDVMVFVGANPTIAHPIMWQRVMSNQRSPEIIVIDPRFTETAQVATQHFPLRPKADLTLLYTLAHILVRDGRLDRDYLENTEGFDEFAEFTREYAPKKTAAECGLSVEQIEKLAQTISEPGKRVSWWWTMGVNQSYEGTRTAQAIINLCLMTGNIGKPGTGPNSITGQCNAMGSRLFSNTTGLVAGHDFTKAEHRQKVAKILEISPDQIQETPGYAYDEILAGIDRGEIKGLWIIATNPNHSWIAQKNFARLREKLDFLVVQDMYHSTETAQLADLVLPAAGWGEKEGTFINSERRFGAIKQVKKAPGEALSDFRIVQLLASRWGGKADFIKKWESPAAAFQTIKELTRGQPCDISGVRDYEHLDQAGGIQWPFPESMTGDRGSETQERRLFEDQKFFTPNKKAKFLFSPPRPVPEATCPEYPFILLTGRGTSSQWHTQTRTAKSAVLGRLYPADCYLEISQADADKLKIRDRESVQNSLKAG